MTDPSLSTTAILEDRDFDDEVSIFPKNVWEYWAVSVMMNDDSVHSTVRFIKGVANTQSE